MPISRWILAALLLTAGTANTYGQSEARGWSVQLSLGELPWQALKPGLSIGYRLNRWSYAGVIVQAPNRIRRDATSFNAQAANLDGLLRSSERMALRLGVQVRAYPLAQGPYLSAGLVVNGRDVETTTYDVRDRVIGGRTYSEALTITQARPAGLRPALGLGYSHTWRHGLVLNTEMFVGVSRIPPPTVVFGGEALLAPRDADVLRGRIAEAFTSTPTNLYHMFHLGVGYAF